VVVTTGICYALIPKYSCGTLEDGSSLPSCNNVPDGTACCTKATNMGWRYVLFTLGTITLTAFFLRFVVFRFHESPKFLLYRGHDEKAVRVLHKIAEFNGRESSISVDVFNALNDRDVSVRGSKGETPILGAGAKQAQSSFGSKVKVELTRYKILFANPTIARLTILVWITYIFDYWGFSVAGKSFGMKKAGAHCLI